jgi:sensor domain CHASE-containing protein/anti-sigma regulatory factor (Ser/Thr protein kinase)
LKLRLRLIIILSLLIGVLITTLYIFSYTAIFSRYQLIENNEVKQELGRTINVLDQEINKIDSTTKDWAKWDDTYSFMADGNQNYVDSNLVTVTFETNDVNVILYYDSSGKLAYGRAYDLDQRTWMEIPHYFLGDLTDKDILAVQPSDYTKGILALPEGAMLFSSQPILTSMGEGPIRGTLVMGRYLDDPKLLKIAEILSISVETRSVSDQSLPQDYKDALAVINPESITPINSSRIAGYVLIFDFSGDPCLILRIDLPREIYLEGQAALESFLVYFIVIGICFGAVMLVVNDRLFVKPITELSEKVAEIGRKGDFDERIHASGDDEGASLIRDINGMLDSFKEAREKELKQRTEVENMRREHFKELLLGASRVINSIRYDLRGPLQVIRNATYLLREDPKKVDTLADMIDESVESAISTIEDLSSKTQTGELNITVTDLRYVIEMAIDMAKVPQNINVVTDFSDEFLAILLDVAKFQRVLDNLIRNAVEAMPKGGTLTVRSRRMSDAIHIEVEDTGIGIRRDDVGKLFQPFYTTKPTGTGLGLVSSKTVIEALGGTIKIESTPGVGTKVTLMLPIRKN